VLTREVQSGGCQPISSEQWSNRAIVVDGGGGGRGLHNCIHKAKQVMVQGASDFQVLCCAHQMHPASRHTMSHNVTP
jgi:hypothetical protein